MSAQLQAADLRFINMVAAKRFAGGEAGSVDDSALAEALGAAAEGTPFVRAAALARALLQGHAFSSAPLQTALLTLHCALSLDGFNLVAPQGVTAGMVKELASNVDHNTVARWLEDRAVPSASG